MRLESTLDAMGTTYSIVVYGADRYRLQSAVDAGFEEVRRIDDLISNYKPRSEWSRVNREASTGAVRVSPELFGLLAACLNYSRATDGAFDITVGPLVRTWGFYKGTGRVPHRAEIRTALTKVGYQKVKLDKENLTVQFTAPVEIDPGGIGKGYAVDRVVAILREMGIQSALVSAGGSSMYGLGHPPGEPEGWKVDIRHPLERGRAVATLRLKDLSMATSGSTEKFFMSGATRYSHIFDPRTGYPAKGMYSVSVVAERGLDAEAWTKPLFILGRRWAEQHLPGKFKAYFCEDRNQPACAWLQ